MELQLNEATKKYGNKVAFDGFPYTFETGVYGILGAIGASKSTMMNLITDNLRRDGVPPPSTARKFVSLAPTTAAFWAA